MFALAFVACSNNNSVIDVKLNPTIETIMVDAGFQLFHTVSPNNADHKAVTWTSSNLEVATVTTSDFVEGVSVGNCIITVTTVAGTKVAFALCLLFQPQEKQERRLEQH